VKVRRAVGRQSLIEPALVMGLWASLAAVAPRFFLLVYLPGWALGLVLCQLQGHFEHARGTTSHYGRLYNLLFFNDGYHVEHHKRPGEHWTRLSGLRDRDRHSSRWPPVLRWLEAANLEMLERLVLRSGALRRFVLSRHERAFRALLPKLGDVRRVTIVGGGLFPRTALIFQKVLPAAALTVIDASADNLETARRFLDDRVEFVHALYNPATSLPDDLVVVPLAFRGDRNQIYRDPPASAVIVHDWIWSSRPDSSCVSWLLLKRLNLIRR
jgi:hypothetical protein